MTLEEINDGLVIEVRAKDSFERGVNLREQAADAVARRGHLSREVVIEAAEHREFRDLLVRELDRSEGVREGPGGFRDDGRVSRVGFRFARVEVRDAAHREPRQVADEDSRGLRDRNRQRADRGRLIDDEQ